MKKLFFIAAMLVSIAATAQQSCVTAKEVSTNYATQEITFKLTWTNCNVANKHNNRVWCFVDYRQVFGATLKGEWKRADISEITSITNATIAPADTYTTGFFVSGTNGATATIRVKLDVPLGVVKFDWCAFATDYPPNATMDNNGTWALRGTPPYYINGSQTPYYDKIYNGNCIGTFTDATRNPESNIVTPTPSIAGGVTSLKVGGVTSWTGTPNGSARTWSTNGTLVSFGNPGGSVTTITALPSDGGSAIVSYNVVVHDCVWVVNREIEVRSTYCYKATVRDCVLLAECDIDVNWVSYTYYMRVDNFSEPVMCRCHIEGPKGCCGCVWPTACIGCPAEPGGRACHGADNSVSRKKVAGVWGNWGANCP